MALSFTAVKSGKIQQNKKILPGLKSQTSPSTRPLGATPPNTTIRLSIWGRIREERTKSIQPPPALHSHKMVTNLHCSVQPSWRRPTHHCCRNAQRHTSSETCSG